MPEKPIPEGVVEKVRQWLGEDGLKFFRTCLKDYGRVDPIIPGSIPHPIHFREGMQVRNFLRSTNLCKGWDDHDYDDNWCKIIRCAIGESNDRQRV